MINRDDYLKLYNYIKDKINSSKMNYIFIDEVQNVSKFQKAVDGLYIQKNVDIYITSSNAYLLSGELATLLLGRYIEIKMLPLSFKEYRLALPNENIDRLYLKYISTGSFPYTLKLNDVDDVEMYIKGIYSSVSPKSV